MVGLRSARRAGRRFVVGVGVSLALGALASCGGGDGTGLSEAGERGRRVAQSAGCAACHGSSGQGGAGPAWVGLAGSDVELTDGTVVVADDDYLRRAIVDPTAERVAGYNIRMPVATLSDEQVADLVAYINDLATTSAD